jgi:hypothetical protein
MSKELITTKDFKSDSERALGIVITTAEEMQEATELLSRANKYLDSVIEYKEKKTKPLNQALKVIRAETKPVETALEAIIDSLRSKATKYQTALIDAQNKQKQAIAGRIGEGKGKLKFETAVAKLENIVAPDKKVESEAGSVTFHPVKHFEVENIEELPMIYHLPDLQSIKDLMKQGTELKGVRYWTEQELINRRR